MRRREDYPTWKARADGPQVKTKRYRRKRRSEIVRELSRMSHDNWRGDYASLESELADMSGLERKFYG